MGAAFFIVCALLNLYVLAILARVLLSWFPLHPDGPMATVAGFLCAVTDPLMLRLRRVIPPVRLGGVALDLSSVVAIFGIVVLRGLLPC